MRDFSVVFKDLRIKNNKTQQELADYLNITARTIRKYESGTCRPTFEGIIKLAEFFGVSTDYLLGLSDDPTQR